MGGELVKSTDTKDINNITCRGRLSIKQRNFQNINLNVSPIKQRKGSFSQKKNRQRNKKISIVSKNKNKELELLELIQNKNKSKTDYQLLYTSLGKHFFMKNLSDQARNEIIENMSLYKISSGTCLYSQGSIGYFWYIVSSGKLNYCVDDKPKKVLSKGDNFGEVALMNNVPHLGTVISITDCKLWAINKDIFNKIKGYLLEVNYKESLEFIKHSDLPLAEEIKLKMANNLVKNIYKEGDIIFQEGDTSSCIYIVKEGEVEAYRNNTYVKSYKENQYFGQNGVLLDHRRTTTTQAKTDCIIYSISVDFFHNLFGENFIDQLYFSLMHITFSRSNNFNKININLLNKAFDLFTFRKIKRDEVVYEEGTDVTKKICLILDGTIVDKTKNKVEGKRLTILFENELVSQNEYKINNTLTAEPDCIIAEADYKKFNDVLGGGLKNANISSQKFKAIDNINLFKNLSEDKKEKIEKNLKLEKFNNGKKIISQGQIGNKLYIIKKGRVDLFLNSKYIKSAREGEDFGSKFLFLKNSKYLMTIIANGYVECYTLSAEICRNILDENLLEYFQKKYHFNDFSIELKDLEFIKELGKGNYGYVNLVKSKKNKQYYAIKAIDINQIKSESLEQHVEQEKSIVLKLDHPFIAKMVKYLKNETKIFFIIEYVHGKDLWDAMRIIGICNNNQTQFYGASMLIVADYLHKLKIIHRDIKPENIMIDDKGYIKFIDFGSAKEIKDRTNTIIGTTQYMAPEILEGSSYSFQVDMWSIAICMYELMCGKVPFGDGVEDDPQLFYQYIMKGDVSFPSFINNENFMNLMHRMLAKDQNKRLYKLEDIKKHPYFKDFDWEKLVTFSLEPPYLLKMNDDYQKQQKTIPYLTYLNSESNKKGNNLSSKRLTTKRETNFKSWLNNF